MLQPEKEELTAAEALGGREGVLLVPVLLKSFEKLLLGQSLSFLATWTCHNVAEEMERKKKKRGGGERLQSYRSWQEDQEAAEVPEMEFNSFF